MAPISNRNVSSNSLGLEKTVHRFHTTNHLVDFTDGRNSFDRKFIPNYAIYCIQCYFNLNPKCDAIKQRSASASIWIYILLLYALLTVDQLAQDIEKENIIHWLRYVDIRDGQLFFKFISGRNKRLSSTNCILNELNTQKKVVIKKPPKLWYHNKK